jgi:hypothetical protein
MAKFMADANIEICKGIIEEPPGTSGTQAALRAIL